MLDTEIVQQTVGIHLNPGDRYPQVLFSVFSPFHWQKEIGNKREMEAKGKGGIERQKKIV